MYIYIDLTTTWFRVSDDNFLVVFMIIFILTSFTVKTQHHHTFVSVPQASYFVPQLNFQTELLWVGQVRGWSRIRLVPREPCDHFCPELLDDLMEGQMGEWRLVLGHTRSQ